MDARSLQPRGLVERVLYVAQHLGGRVGRFAFFRYKARKQAAAVDLWRAAIAELGPGDHCLDLGANVGSVARQLAKTGASVVACEPDPDTFERLQANLVDSPNVEALQVAVAAKAGVATLRRAASWRDDREVASLSSSIVRVGAGMSADDTVDVEVVAIADLLERIGGRVKLVKIDIEGLEWEVLDALLESPMSVGIDYVFVETHEHFDFDRLKSVSLAHAREARRRTRPIVNLYWH